MWQLDNRTPYAAGQGWVRNLDGAETWLVVVKGTFDVLADGSVGLAAVQPAPARSAVYSGPAGSSSIVCESDFVLDKTTTDVVLNGAAHAPGGKPCPIVDVGLRVSGLTKLLRVFGNRTWSRAGEPSSPQAFTVMPLTYERAFGGIDRGSAHPDRDWYWPNPVGAGFMVARDHLASATVPNVEYPDELLTAWDDRPRPAGFGCLGPHWQERAGFAGTYGADWLERRQPLLPYDFDMRHFQCVGKDQQTAAFLRGGEPVALLNLTPSGMLRFSLPTVDLAFVTHFADGERREHVPKLHTVIIEPGFPRVALVWHGALECHSKVYLLDHTRIELAATRLTRHDEAMEDLLGPR